MQQCIGGTILPPMRSTSDLQHLPSQGVGVLVETFASSKVADSRCQIHFEKSVHQLKSVHQFKNQFQ